MKTAGGIVALLLTALIGPVFAQEALPPDAADPQFMHPVMHPDSVTLHKWIDDRLTAPRAEIDPVIHSNLLQAQSQGLSTSLNLMNYLPWTTATMSQRSQGGCGDCWVWAGTGQMEIALGVQNGILDRLSPQFFNSCKTDNFACCGGNLWTFSNWYSSEGYTIPWSNTNASFYDASTSYNCPQSGGSPAVSCANISTTPHYSIASISPATVSTVLSDGSADPNAIAHIKNVLNQNKAVEFDFCLANSNDWYGSSGFDHFWSNNAESVVWDPDSYCGHTSDNYLGCHAVIVVGYNDTDSTPYWIVLNSWGTAGGLRPNGLFRMKMNMNYACSLYESGYGYFSSLSFETLNVAFNVAPPPDIQIVSPNGEQFWTVGSTHPITWTSSNLNQAGQIYGYYWYNSAWQQIFGPLSASSTSQSWTVPNAPTTSVYIRVGNWVAANNDWEPSAQSDQAFAIIGNFIYVAQTGQCGSHNPCLHSILNGIASATTPSLINLSQETYYESVTLSSGQAIILQGGWDTNFTSQSSATTVHGSITISHGTMIVGNIVVR